MDLSKPNFFILIFVEPIRSHSRRESFYTNSRRSIDAYLAGLGKSFGIGNVYKPINHIKSIKSGISVFCNTKYRTAWSGAGRKFHRIYSCSCCEIDVSIVYFDVVSIFYSCESYRICEVSAGIVFVNIGISFGSFSCNYIDITVVGNGFVDSSIRNGDSSCYIVRSRGNDSQLVSCPKTCILNEYISSSSYDSFNDITARNFFN